MKFRLYDDLHTEFAKFKNWPKDNCKDIVLLLAGDIGVGLSARNMIEAMCKYYKDVVLVPGNHEYYHNVISDVDERWNAVDDSIENFHYLQNKTVIIDGVRLIGGTMWTSLQQGDWWHGYNASQKMNDYRLIKYRCTGKGDIRTFDTFTSRNLFAQFKSHLENELSKDWEGRTVVITHHSPCELSVEERYKGSALNCAYYEDMTSYMFADNAPDLWCHGHLHSTSDYIIGNTRIIANPRGYVGHEANNTFNPAMLIEI